MSEANTKKAILLICDGMGDRLVGSLDERTPLEAAETPNLDRLAIEGESGLMDPIAPGVRAGSDTAHLAILGYDPYETYTGRGPFEAVGIGMDVEGGDVAFRCNFATVDENFVVQDRRAGRIEKGTRDLAQALNGMQIEDVTCYFKESVAHRAALVLRGPNLGDKVTDVDPHEEGAKVLECRAESPDDEASVKTARILNAFVKKSYEILKDHPVNVERRKLGKPPANIALPRGVGLVPHLAPIDEKWKVRSAMIVEVGLLRGLAKLLKSATIDVEGATGGIDTDTSAIGAAIVETLKKYDFVLCNVKGPDVCGHDGEPEKKVEIIERIDSMVGEILDKIGDDVLIVVTADHSTPVSVMDHSGDPTPIVFWGPGVRTDDVLHYSERAAAKGSIGRIRGMDVMPMITNLMGVQEKFGA